MIKNILIVDDSPVARKILTKCLPQDRDFELTEAGDGKEGFEKFKELNPDVTFLDLTMPVMDGLEALEAMRKQSAKSVIIVVTADIQQKTLLRVKDLGASMVVKKPPSPESIYEALIKAEKIIDK